MATSIHLPISHDSSCTLNNWHQSQVVVGLHICLYYEIAEARREQSVGIAVAAVQRYSHLQSYDSNNFRRLTMC